MPVPIIGALPVILTNGTVGDANQVMADFNYILGQVNANAAPVAGGTYVPLGGGTMTGGLTIAPSGTSVLILTKSGSGFSNSINATNGGLLRWQMVLGDGVAEGGANSGSDLEITRFNDSGSVIDSPLAITRSSGNATFNGAALAVSNAAGVTLQLTGPNATVKQIVGYTGTVPSTAGTRWVMQLGNGTSESGSNVGSDLSLSRYGDTGTLIDTPLSITRSSGAISLMTGVAKTVGTGVSVGARGISYSQYAANFVAFQWGTPAGAFTVWIDNTSVGTITPVVSDTRLKDNIAEAEGDALGEIRQIELMSYDLPDRVNPGNPARHFAVGFSAQQIEPIIPEAVHQGEDMLSLDLMPLLARCVGAIQQLTARVETLEAKLAT